MPSGVKSRPLGRMRARQGFDCGRVKRSQENAPCAALRTMGVSIFSVQRAGLPRVNAVRSRGAAARLARALRAAASVPDFARCTARRSGVAEAGIRRVMKRSSAAVVTAREPETATAVPALATRRTRSREDFPTLSVRTKTGWPASVSRSWLSSTAASPTE